MDINKKNIIMKNVKKEKQRVIHDVSISFLSRAVQKLNKMDEEIEKAAEYYKVTHGFITKGSICVSNSNERGNSYCDISLTDAKNGLKRGFIAGVKSNIAKQYWLNEFNNTLANER